MTEQQEDTRHFYWLVCGNVIVQTENGGVPLMQNAVLATDDGVINVFQIGKAQQALQETLARKMGGELQPVIDVIIVGFSPLGLMTEAEFHAQPEGMQLQEMLDSAVASANLNS